MALLTDCQVDTPIHQRLRIWSLPFRNSVGRGLDLEDLPPVGTRIDRDHVVTVSGVVLDRDDVAISLLRQVVDHDRFADLTDFMALEFAECPAADRGGQRLVEGYVPEVVEVLARQVAQFARTQRAALQQFVQVPGLAQAID